MSVRRSDYPQPTLYSSRGWIFGYGSIVFRPAFAVARRRLGYLRGWVRRFYQGSPDHRGTVAAPGRVVTLLEAPENEVCWGVAYQVPADEIGWIHAQLELREIAGYRKLLCPIYGARVPRPIVEKALVYYAGPANPYYLGPAPLEKMAEQIAGARGGSGSNREYLLKLANSLHSLDVHDAHVKTLANAVTHRVFL